MHVVYCIYSGPGGISMPSGWITRGIQLMRGLQRAGAEVTIIIRGNPNDIPLPDDVNFIIGEPEEVIEGMLDTVDLVYVRGHPLVSILKTKFPTLPICLELYLYPWDNTPQGLAKQAASFDAYKYTDAFVVVGKEYHKYSINWLKNRYNQTIKPNMIINATYDDTASLSLERDIAVGIFDSVSPPHCTVHAVKALAELYGVSNYVGCSCVKDGAMLSKITQLAAEHKWINLITPQMTEMSDYYSKCISTVALYSHDYKYFTLDEQGKKRRNFLTSIRVVESLGYGCIPVVTHNDANKEILGEHLDMFSVPDINGPELVSHIAYKLEDIIMNATDYYNVLMGIDVSYYSSTETGKRLYTFLRGV